MTTEVSQTTTNGDQLKIVRAFADLFSETGPTTQEEVDEMLHTTGHDPDEVAAKMKTTAEQAFTDAILTGVGVTLAKLGRVHLTPGEVNELRAYIRTLSQELQEKTAECDALRENILGTERQQDENSTVFLDADKSLQEISGMPNFHCPACGGNSKAAWGTLSPGDSKVTCPGCGASWLVQIEFVEV